MNNKLTNYKLEETYQEPAVKELLEKTNEFIDEDIKKGTNLMVFQAITGAGKTIMMGDYIKKVSKEYDNVAFVWISTGNGGLVEQSFIKIKDMLSNHIKFYNHENILTVNSLTPKSVFFINWEKINLSDNKNRLMKIGEKNNLPDIFNNTRKNGVKIILIIDEGHHTAHSNISLDIRQNLIKPIITIEVSATPSDVNGLEINKRDYVQVDIKKVIEAGVIKKNIKINNNYKKHRDNYNIYQELLGLAIEKHSKLYDAYDRKINPLILVQIPDGKEGEELKKYIIDYLRRIKGIKETQIAVWLSEDKMNLEKDKIGEWDNPVKILIFKTAIATGWDCPRAHILVKFREVQSTSFNTQIIGRIIRMPERKHYEKEILNSAYIYTNEKEIILDSEVEIPKTYIDLVVPIKEEFKEEVKNIKLPKQHLKKSKKKNLTQYQIEELFKFEIDNIEKDMPNDESYFKLDKSSYFNITKETEVSSSVLQIKDKQQVDVEYSTFEHNAKDCELAFEKIINKHVPKCNWDDMKSTIFLEFRERYGYTSSIEIHKIVKAYEEDFIEIFNKIFTNINDPNPEIRDLEIKIPIEKLYKVDTDLKEYENCLYEKHGITSKEPETEIIFEDILLSCKNVKWWFKNNDRGKDYVSVVYKHTHEDLDSKESFFAHHDPNDESGYEEHYHSFYPDYTIMFNDGSIGFYEVKDVGTSKQLLTQIKMKALEEYLANTEFKCGLIVVDQSTHSITTESKIKNMDIFK